jgi:uncharacterized damage-inducible protein DinB
MRAPVEPPRDDIAEPVELLLGYLDFYRDVVVRKLDGLSDADLRSTQVPSGWTPLQLLKHLVFMERRWLQWGFAAEQVAEPWGDNGPDEAWATAAEDSFDSLVAKLRNQAEITRSVVGSASLSDLAAPGGRFPADGTVRPTLAWILFHVLQEYSRHAGHLDVARELLDGATGE